MSFAKSDVILLPIPFSDLSSRKVRPAVVIGHSSHAGDLFVVPISSQLQNVDLTLQDWRQSGLNVACGIKSQIATVEDRLVVKRLGRLSTRDQIELERRLRGWLALHARAP
jgi:mRNA interferase MazF